MVAHFAGWGSAHAPMALTVLLFLLPSLPEAYHRMVWNQVGRAAVLLEGSRFCSLMPTFSSGNHCVLGLRPKGCGYDVRGRVRKMSLMWPVCLSPRPPPHLPAHIPHSKVPSASAATSIEH